MPAWGYDVAQRGQLLSYMCDNLFMSSYYVNNAQGNPMDRALLEKMAELQAGQGDGRVSKDDAPHLAEKVNDGGQRTAIEDRTVRKVYRDANFTAAGRALFATINRSEGAKRAWVRRKAEEAAAQAVTDV